MSASHSHSSAAPLRRPWLGRLVGEPLVHFVALGGLLFGLYANFGGDDTDLSGPVVIDGEWAQGVRAGLGHGLGRAPTQAELAEGLAVALDDELLYREALGLGLGRGDPIVRRRLIQRARFLYEDRAELGGVDEAELAVYLRDHAKRYRSPDRLRIIHAFAAADRRSDPESVVRGWSLAIAAGENPMGLGDAFAHGQRIGLRSAEDLDALFGAGFSARLEEVEVGDVVPLRSSYGWHAVRLEARAPAKLPALASIRARVERDFSEERRRRAVETGLHRLRERVPVRVELEDAELRAALMERL